MRMSLVRVLTWVLYLALCLGTTVSCWNHNSRFTAGHLLVADATQLRHTRIVAHLREPIRPGENLLWCGTFQLAWNETADLMGGGPLRLASPTGVTDALNRREFVKEFLDEDSYVALADFVRNRPHARIRSELLRKFHGRATPRLIPDPALTPRPQDIVAYAYLYKDLAFPAAFEDVEREETFAGQPVAWFGVDGAKPGQERMHDQVTVWQYRSRSECIVELASKSGRDRIILAKVHPGKTLADTIASVSATTSPHREAERGRGASGPGASRPNAALPGLSYPCTMLPGDILMIPKMNFDLVRQYTELEGLRLAPSRPGAFEDRLILSAAQAIRFQMDKEGVRLRSESHIAIGCGAPPARAFHVLLFDSPFLLMLQRHGAAMPYFALWVDNAELLARLQATKEASP